MTFRSAVLLLPLAAWSCAAPARTDPPSAQKPALPPGQEVRSRLELLYPLAVFGHRGTQSAAELPENSLAAFTAAVLQGADGVELDVTLTAEGNVVVLHDGTLDRTSTCTGCVNRRGRDETRRCRLLGAEGRPSTERVPTLAEVFSTLPGGALVNLDLRLAPECEGAGDAAPLARATVKEVSELGVASRTLFTSSSPDVLKVVKQENPTLYAVLQRAPQDEWREALAIAKALKLDAVQAHHSLAADGIADLRANGFQVHLYVVDDPEVVAVAMKQGATSVVSNQPGTVRAAVPRPPAAEPAH